MKRKTRGSKRILILLLLPLSMIAFTTVAYGVWQNYVASNINLTVATEKPTITITNTLINTYNNSVTLLVNSTTKIIEATEPAFPLIYIKTTNTGRTPIDKITLDSTIPHDWTLRDARMQLVQADQTYVEIAAAHFTIENTPENNVIITTSNIRDTLGKSMNQNESIIISLSIEYSLMGQPLTTEYETSPPLYTNTVTATAWVGSWQSQPKTSTLVFTTNIGWT